MRSEGINLIKIIPLESVIFYAQDMLARITISCLLFFSTLSFCYGQNGHSILSEYFKTAQEGKSESVPVNELRSIPLKQFLEGTAPYLKAENAFVRYKAIDLIKRKGGLLDNAEDRKALVGLLVQACKDTDGGNSGVASNALLLFKSDDFSPLAVEAIVSLVKQPGYYYDRVIRIAGFINTPETTAALNELKKNDSTLSKKQKWALDMALARTGNKASLNYCMEKITGVPVNDKSVDYLFPDLTYIRQPVALDYMLQEILSDEKKCKSSNPDAEENIICAFKIMELVAPVIEEFPVKLTSYGELNIENYDDTLLKVRVWIKDQHKYTVILNIY